MMNKLLKKTLATLSCAIIIGQTILTSIVGATEELLTNVDLGVTKRFITTSIDTKDKMEVTKTTTNSIDLVIGDGNTNNTNEDNSNQTSTQTDSDKNTDQETTGTAGDNSPSQGSEGTTSEGVKQCNPETKSEFMNGLSAAVNDLIKEDTNSNFKNAKVSEDNNTLILFSDDENAKLPDLTKYSYSIIDYIDGKIDKNSIEYRFWNKLEKLGIDLSIQDFDNLTEFYLGKVDVISVDGCGFSFKIEIENDNTDDNGKCSNEIKSTFLNNLSDAVNELIKNSNNTGFKRAEASVDNDTLILYIEDENVKIPDLTNYIVGLVDHILGKDASDKTENQFWDNLAEKNEGLDLSISTVTNLVNLQLGSNNKLYVYFKDCYFTLNLELKLEDSNPNGGNNGNNEESNKGNGYSGVGSHGNNSNNSSRGNNDEVVLSGEVSDEVMEVKKAESCSIEGSTYSDEENHAYLWACEKGITIADNIMKADMNKNLTRAELAKMMSVYSEELLGRTRIKNKGVTYPDVDSSLGDLEYYIQEGYRLQIMGIHADGSALSKFSPNSNVTRGEFGTVFSRVLHGNIYNIGNSHYYEKHLEVLKNEGILKNTNPKLIEKRGWILLMLYRSQKVEESNGNISNEEIVNITGEKEEAKNETGENVAEVETGNNTETSGN